MIKEYLKTEWQKVKEYQANSWAETKQRWPWNKIFKTEEKND